MGYGEHTDERVFSAGGVRRCIEALWRGNPLSDIFISYAEEDREQARRLAEALEAQGWSVF